MSEQIIACQMMSSIALSTLPYPGWNVAVRAWSCHNLHSSPQGRAGQTKGEAAEKAASRNADEISRCS